MTRLKTGLGLIGFLLAIAGIALESRIVVWVAIAALGTSLLIRIVLAIQERRRAE